MRLVVSGGGTGGHIYPALAFMKTVREADPNAEFLYIGTEKGLEKSIVGKENIPFETIEISGFKRKLSPDNVKTAIQFLRGVRRSKALLKRFRPDIVVGTGGYVCGPVVYAAHRLGIPTMIHEQNSVPGLTNKFLSRYVDKIAISFAQSARYFPEEKTVLTGNPRATEVLGFDGKKGLEKLGLAPDKKTVLIFAGSRGARPINEAVLQALPRFAEKDYQILYVTGEVHFEAVYQHYAAAGGPKNVFVKPFLHEMQEILSGVDLVVSRAGATTIAEITSLGLPAILIPSPYVTNNHQEKNAMMLQEKGAARVILERELDGGKLAEEIDKILFDENRLEEMKKASKSLGIGDAARRMYRLAEEMVRSASGKKKS
ncbi:undecaprenyldiphospho-muramoylpentapeptide beta-N-acetylglucosaminyltransferase [Caldibacillus debilis]|jgi:UDP-N-acetylglucosamine--N-acetylmuramyl-(pentapeptide) pyrophosphoryl-undecaprenol N-acetylglucosamine transferase|uniref:UDP-N-acetylglucosamine--N-acetylmuramyl-(pentapeptide) pyrophosphoryl-undecaprenol N-acetylglucosamine transferase n=1 Tax=Caldibacillus debilis GB1 TaxID=1339248 RepID=A0A420VKL4_9BACI|nr:undecaprenyldiphospho-muramoylpentapeptide beta-N-acetylglucosaminyltransferase [Caldibacillus debilis]RKO63893.1 UDP-N-acetylglucosamine-N-acetylmuramylpentapeptide N-acetylglucosamine transferase [Caldibacillus debilis GB1]